MKKIVLVFGFLAATLTANAQGNQRFARLQQRFEDGIYSRPGKTTTKAPRTSPADNVKDEITVDENGNMVIGGIDVYLQKNRDGYTATVTCISSKRGSVEHVRDIVKKSAMKIDIEDCGYEAFKTSKGKYLLVPRKDGYFGKEYNGGFVENKYVAFEMYNTKSDFETAVFFAVRSHREKIDRIEKHRIEIKKKREAAMSFF